MVNKGKDSAPRCAIYPGTFDPIHNGHIDVIRRSVAIFDEVIVAVAYNPHKDPALFSPDERVDMIRETIRDLEPRARVDKFSGLSVDYAQRIGAHIIIRGLRAVSDFEAELQMAHTNRKLQPGVDTVFLMSALDFGYLSSSLAKEVAQFGGDINGMVPAPVAAALGARFPQGT